MKFTMIASGSSGNCCIVEEENTRIMIDCGGSKAHLMGALTALQLQITDIDALFLTHGHIDHIARIKTLQHLESYGTFEVAKNGHHIIDTHQEIRLPGMVLTSIPLSHDFPKTIGYVIETEKEKLVYITDTGYLNERYFDQLQNADYYVFESNHDPKMLMETSRPYPTKQRILSSEGHLSNIESATALTTLIGARTQQVFLAHLSKEANVEQLALDTLYKALDRERIATADKRILAARQFELLYGGKQ